MDGQSKADYDSSLANFLMVKIFHGAGVDVHRLSHYIFHAGYTNDPCIEILIEGTSQLFSNLAHYSCYSDDEDEVAHCSRLQQKLGSHSEFYICLSDRRIDSVMKSEAIYRLKSQTDFLMKNLKHTEAELVFDEEYGLIVGFQWEGFLYEMAEVFTTVHKDLEQI